MIAYLGSDRIVVVQGATSARRSRGMAASRDNTTTGRRPLSGNSHHHSSPRAGISVTKCRRLDGTTPGLHMRPARRVGADHTRRSSHRSRRRGAVRGGLRGLRRPRLRQSTLTAAAARLRAASRRQWCSHVCEPCHEHATRGAAPSGWVTSVMLALHPELVEAERAESRLAGELRLASTWT